MCKPFFAEVEALGEGDFRVDPSILELFVEELTPSLLLRRVNASNDELSSSEATLCTVAIKGSLVSFVLPSSTLNSSKATMTSAKKIEE